MKKRRMKDSTILIITLIIGLFIICGLAIGYELKNQPITTVEETVEEETENEVPVAIDITTNKQQYIVYLRQALIDAEEGRAFEVYKQNDYIHVDVWDSFLIKSMKQFINDGNYSELKQALQEWIDKSVALTEYGKENYGLHDPVIMSVYDNNVPVDIPILTMVEDKIIIDIDDLPN